MSNINNLRSFQMTAVLKTVLFEEFVSIDVIGFRTLTANERLENGGASGMVLEYRVILKVKATAALETTLQEGFTTGMTLGAVSIGSFRVGGRYFSCR